LRNIFDNQNDSRMSKTLRRSSDKIIAGVCGGVADYFGLDKVLIRAIYLLLVLFGGVGVLVYIILWIVMPSR